MSERKEGVIFDLDGVLCSTDEYHYRAWKSLADSLGIAFDRTVNRRLRGVSREESLEIVLEKAGKEYSAEEKRQLCSQKNELYRKFLPVQFVHRTVVSVAYHPKFTIRILRHGIDRRRERDFLFYFLLAPESQD